MTTPSWPELHALEPTLIPTENGQYLHIVACSVPGCTDEHWGFGSGPEMSSATGRAVCRDKAVKWLAGNVRENERMQVSCVRGRSSVEIVAELYAGEGEMVIHRGNGLCLDEALRETVAAVLDSRQMHPSGQRGLRSGR